MRIQLIEIAWHKIDHLWLGIFEIETKENSYHLLYVEYDHLAGCWKFDFLWLRSLIYKMKDKLERRK